MKIRAGTSPTLSGFLALTALALPFPLAAQSSRTPAQDKDAEEQARVDRQYRFEESLARQYGTRDLRDLLKRAAETRVREIERDRELRKYRRDRGLSPQAGPTWSTLGPTSRIHRLSSVTSDDNGLVASIAINPNDRNNIFIGSAGGGVWRTRDGGTTWSLVTGNVGILQIGAVALAPSQPTRVYAGTGCADASSFRLGNARSTGYPLKLGVGVLISNDGGDTWRVSRTSPADYFWQILVDPTNPDILLVAGDRGVQRSTDGGDTWSAVLAGETTPWATRLTRPNSPATTIFAATWGPGVAGSVYKSTDSGVTWAVKANGLPGDDSTRTRVEVAVAPADANRVYALIDGGGTQLDFARSTDGGETWAGLNVNSKVPTNAPDATVNILTKQGDFCNVLAVDPSNPAVVHAGGTDMWKTTDGGETWLWATDWKGTERNYVHADIHTVVFGPDGTLYNGNDGGLFSSADGGLSYRALNRGTLSFLVSGLCFDENNPDRIAIGAQDNGNSLRVSGTDWRETTTGDGFGCVFHPTSSDFLFVSTQNQNILRTSDGGQTFRRRVEGLTKALTKDAVFGTLVVGSPGSGAFRLYTHTKKKIWISDDNAESWRQLSEDMPVIDNIADFSIQRTDGNRMVLMDNRGQVVVSTDGGKIWRKAGEAPGLYRSRVRLDNADGNRIYVVSRDPRKEQQRFWVSTNAGTDWTALSNTGQPTGLPDLPINAFEQDPANAATLWAGTFIGLYRSTDAGQTWARYGEGLPSVPVMDIKIAANGSLIRIGTFGRGVWEVRPTAGSAAPGTVAGPANPPRTLAAPVASFDVTTAEPRPGRRVAFADTSSGIPSSWSWKFGDGGTSKEENPSHVFLTPGTYNVELTATNASGSGTTTRSVSVAFPNTGTGDALTYLLPAVLVAAGQGGSLFSTELTLVNRASVPLSLTFRTKGATESSATYTLQVGQQVFPDAIAFLRERGAALPAGNVTVSLRIEVRGAGEIGQFGSQVRITTPPNESQRAQGIAGRFGLAFPAIPLRTAANREAVVYGLQQTSETGQAGTRSNLACVNAGGGSAIELEVTYHDGETGKDHAQKDSFSLATFEFQQKSTPLRSRAIKRGWATIKRTSGDSQFFCYGVLNDNLNSDGSFVPMLNVDAAEPASSAVVPVVVGTDTFKSELTLANRTKKKISGEMAVIPSTTGEPEYGSFEIEAGRQDVYPDIVASLRQAGFTLPSGTVASIYITFENAGSTGGDDPRAGDDDPPAPVSTSDAYVNIRTYATRAGGLFGQAYGQVPLGRAADTEAYVFGLQQTGTRGVEGGTRANLAIIHALSGLEEDMVLEVTYFGPSGQELGKEADTTLKPGQWKQFNSPLQRFDVPGGYARIRRLSGSDQFIAYGVLNDQANDDGSFVPMTVP